MTLPEPDSGKYIGWDGAVLANLSLIPGGGISDTAYSSTTWDGVDTIAPSKNAVRDKVETLAKSGANADITSMTGLGGDGISPGGALVADEAEITLATGKTGRGWAMAGDNEEYINFRFTAAGVVTVISNSANAVNTDTDGNLCVYDAGNGIAIKNRLGATKNIRYIINYS